MLFSWKALSVCGAFVVSGTVVTAQNDHWNPRHWRKNITIFFNDGHRKSSMFPDVTLVNTRDYGNSWDMVHCFNGRKKWLDNTIDNIDRNFFRTTEGCYIDEDDIDSAAYRLDDGIVGWRGPLHNYTALIPYCGPKRPYEVWKIAHATDQSGKVDNSNNKCWSCPSLDCPSFAAAQWTDHTYCWINGQTVEGNTRWYESGHTFNENGTACYVPKKYILGDKNAISKAYIPGGNEECDY